MSTTTMKMTGNQKRMIAVWGATGNQGCSVVHALSKDGNWSIRAITRDRNSKDAMQLKKECNCEMFECDYTGPMDKIVEAMKGCYGAFLMTNFWDPKTMNKEDEMGRKLVDAAKQAGVKHVIWSTLPNVHKISKGKYHVPHFTDKAKVEEYIREMCTQGKKTFEHATFVAPAFYYQNFDSFFPPKKEGDMWVFSLPNIPRLISFNVEDTGPAVCGAFNHPDKWDMKRIDYVGTNMPTEDYVKTYGKVTGKKCRLNAVSIEDMTKQNKEMGEMFGWFKDFGYYGPDCDPKSGQELTPGGLMTWEKYCETQKNRPE